MFIMALLRLRVDSSFVCEGIREIICSGGVGSCILCFIWLVMIGGIG